MVQAACPSVATAQRFTLNGAEITDKVTGLVWARCSAGQTWNGSTCAGSAVGFTLDGAFALAKQTTGWRLPSVKELSSLVDEGCQLPSIDSVGFPNAPIAYFWTSTPVIDAFSNGSTASAAWNVEFGWGGVEPASLTINNYGVRLVRVSQ